MNLHLRNILVGLCLVSFVGCSPKSTKTTGGDDLTSKEVEKSGTAKVLTVYSSRKTHLLQPLVDLYQKKTGVEVKIVNGKAGALIERLRQEGAATIADVLFTVDAGNLWYASSQGLLLPIQSEVLEKEVPEAYRGSKGDWYGLSLRARSLFYNSNLIKSEKLSSYEALANKDFKGELCLRTSNKVYNQSLVASIIERHGVTKTKEILRGWVGNLAKPVFTSDSLLLKAIDSGDCKVGVANTYYLARLKKKGEAKNVKIFWPNQGDGKSGVHVNVSGAGVVSKSKNPKLAQQFVEWMLSDDIQKILAESNDEFPVKSSIGMSDLLKSWGPFQKDKMSMDVFGRRQKEAIQLMDAAKYL